MKFIILSVMLFGLIAADVSHLHRGSHFGGSLNSQHYSPSNAATAYARILKSDYRNDGYGTYNFEYETENGISHNEDGTPDNSKHGQYSYTGDDGKVYTVMYWADESGFHAVGDHLPGSQNAGNSGHSSSYRGSSRAQKPNVHSSGSIGGAKYNYPKPNSGYAAPKPNSGYNNAAPKPKSGYNYPAPTAKSGYNYPAPTAKSGYNYPPPKQAYLPPRPKPAHSSPKPKTAYLPPAPPTNYLPPKL